MKLNYAVLIGAVLLVVIGGFAALACDNCPNTCTNCGVKATGDDYLTRCAMTQALLRLPETERKDFISHLFRNYKRACKAEEKSRMRSYIFYHIYQESLAAGRLAKVTFATKNPDDLVMYVPEFAVNAQAPEKTAAKSPAFARLPLGSYYMWTVDQYGNPTSDRKIFEITDRYYFISL